MSVIVHSVPQVTMDQCCYLPSTWRRAIGKLLTNHRITYYTRLGFYGKEAQERATKKIGLRPCEREGCKSRFTVFMRFSYLPHAMWCCESCRQMYKIDNEKSEAAAKSLRDKLREANRAIKGEQEAHRAQKRALNEIVFE